MKRNINKIILNLAFLFAALGLNQAHAYANDSYPGEIRQSILSEEQFRNTYGEGWILMDGRNIENSDLARTYGLTNVPDARGVFLRGKNHNRDDGKGDPHGDQTCGTYQEDQLKSHKHTDKGHSHGFDLNFFTSNNVGGAQPARGGGHHHEGESVVGNIKTGQADIEPTGGSETRPRCIVVNTFIKINLTKDTQLANLRERLFALETSLNTLMTQ